VACGDRHARLRDHRRRPGAPSACGSPRRTSANWSEPLGLAAPFVEGAVIVVAGYALAALQPVRALTGRGRASLATAR
jgi:hypothetical protein